MIIRPFELKDAATVADIIRRNLVEVNTADYSPIIIATMIDRYNREAIGTLAQTRDMFVAEDASAILGTVSLDGSTVYTLFVEPARHSQGIGSALMDHVETLAKHRGHSHIDVPASLTAHKFYINRGYQELRKAYDGPELTAIIMEKKLT